jgi:hypothetical protein
MVKTKKFIFAKRFVGEPKADDFTLVEEELPPLKEGGKVIENNTQGRIILELRPLHVELEVEGAVLHSNFSAAWPEVSTSECWFSTGRLA